MFFRKKKIKFEIVLNVKSMTKRKRKRKRNILQIEIRKIKKPFYVYEFFFYENVK